MGLRVFAGPNHPVWKGKVGWREEERRGEEGWDNSETGIVRGGGGGRGGCLFLFFVVFLWCDLFWCCCCIFIFFLFSFFLLVGLTYFFLLFFFFGRFSLCHFFFLVVLHVFFYKKSRHRTWKENTNLYSTNLHESREDGAPPCHFVCRCVVATNSSPSLFCFSFILLCAPRLSHSH